MNAAVLRRFIILMAIATAIAGIFGVGYMYVNPSEPGDYEVRRGDQLLSDGEFSGALEQFDEALKLSPDHRGALMGRAIVFLQTERYPEAEAELTYLIGFLNRTLEPDDLTGIGVLAAAYANRGILYDRTGRYEKALADYIEVLKRDRDLAEGPGIIDKVLYGMPKPATVERRAIYLKQQLALPESERLLRVPELDEEQRMFKP